MAPKVPPSGIWCPAVTAFDPSTDKLDLAAQAKYYSYLASSGLAGLVILGTNAETFLLTRDERASLIKCARDAVGPSYPLMAGVGGHSTAQVLEHCRDAADAGADYALCLPPGYFGKATTPAVIDSFFADVATKSPIPIVLYNFPAVCNGVDLQSDTIYSLASRFPDKIVGVKLTCGSVAKIVRLAAQLPADKFAVFGGQSDFLLGGLASGSAGCIAAFANPFPRTLSKIYQLWTEGKNDEAMALHRTAALAEQPCKSGIGAVKYAAAVNSAKRAGLEGDLVALFKPRKPYDVGISDAARKAVDEGTKELVAIEASL